MSRAVSISFLILVIVQGLHSIEEYIGELWTNLPPATFLCGLISDDLEIGFLVINIGLFVFGILGWLFLVRNNHSFAKVVIGFWLVIEIVNGIGHPVWAIYNGRYEPGVITAPILFVVAVFLILQLRKIPRKTT